MRRFFWFILFLIGISMIGCVAVDSASEAYRACLADSYCQSQMQANGQIARSVVDSTTTDGGIIAGLIASIVSGITGVIAGRKLIKKKKV